MNLKDGENPDDKRILLCVYMGFAAFNISGQTICSAFHKKMYQTTIHLSADEFNTFRIKYRNLKIIINDEISMVGNRTLNFINTRLQQLVGTKEVFGGLSVIAVGVGMIVVHTANVDVKDGLTNGATGMVKHIDFRMEETNRPSIIWVLFDDPRVGRTTREKYRKLYNSNIHSEWTPVFDVQRTFIVNYKTYQRIQFPLTPASGKSVWKAEGATVDRVVVDLSQDKRKYQIPHIHYVAFSRVKKLEDLYILNMNEAAMALDEDVNVEMQRLRTEATLELCYVPLYKIDPHKNKIAFNNARSLHKHFKDVEFEPNVLAEDAIGFAETRLCRRGENVHFALKRFRLIRLYDTEKESVNRPHHGLALYVKEYFQMQKVVKIAMQVI